MSPRVYLDLTAGVGGLPLYWTSGGNVRPVVSRIGNKWGYASAICRIRGLSWRRPPEVLLLNDADPEIAGLWRCLLDPEIARAAAAMIRGWAGEEPRPLWDRLRARLASSELAPPSVEWAASTLCAGVWSYRQGYPDSGFVGPGDRRQDTTATATATATAKIAEWAAAQLWVHRRSYQGSGHGYAPPDKVATVRSTGGLTRYKPDAPAPAIEALAEWAAAWSTVAAWSACGKPGDGYRGPGGNLGSWANPISLAGLATRAESIPSPTSGAVALNARADQIPVPTDARGWLVYADPPYQGTTGYRCEWPRAEVLEVARRWADAGASVMLSEAEPLDLPGWHHVEITALRTGQARTFSKQQREWLTLSEPPAWRPPVQRSLFAVGAL